jgi:two-component system cell cycle response regulator DivK
MMAGELILVIEDNHESRKLVRDLLSFKGYTIVEAENGEDGIRLASERLPRLILMDLRLPGIDGIETLRRIRPSEATRRIPVIAVTASSMGRGRRTIMTAGFDGYQSKPLQVKTFLAMVEEYLAR